MVSEWHSNLGNYLQSKQPASARAAEVASATPSTERREK